MQFLNDSLGSQVPLAMLVIATVLTGLWFSNIIYDSGVQHYVSRKVGHGAGGVAFLLCLMFSSPVWPVILSGGFGAVLIAARLFRPATFRGVGGTGRSNRAMAEIWFACVAVPVFLVSWSWLDRPEIAVASLLFMAWGDGITGLVRSQIYHTPTKGWWGSLGMLAVCLVLALVFVKPVWIGIVAAVVCVLAEKAFGDVGKIRWADDNLVVPLVGMGTMLGLLAVTGNL
ncbi:MAG: hypothetical protein A2147_11055 [Chloroflexi bacterium RBG_16_57_8]|nr:MAG: hypothetical protein A2147_11055 [Chloroflexi bacterium RBG_16_57_8]